MRYRVYTWKAGWGYQRHQVLLRSHLYRYLSLRNAVCGCKTALQGGLTLVQYRDKTDDGVQLTQTQQLSNLAINTVPFSLSTTRVDAWQRMLMVLHRAAGHPDCRRSTATRSRA